MNSGNDMSRTVESYYSSHESRWGYQLLLGGRKHFGYYPKGGRWISNAQAMDNMEAELFKRLACPPGARVLDAGSGEGAVALNLARRYGLEVEGVELVERNIAVARERKAKSHVVGQVNFTQTSYADTPFPDNHFDAVYSMETLVHAPDHEAALQELHRVLRPGGSIVSFEYTMPRQPDMDEISRRAFEKVILGSSMTSMPRFVNGTMEAIYAGAGFEDVRVDDLSWFIEPMLREFWILALGPYRVARLLGMERHAVNAMAGVEFFVHRDKWRYVAVVGQKPE